MNEGRFDALYNEFNNLVYYLALSYINFAENETQEVFVKVYQRFADYKPERASLKVWIYQITINHGLDVIKT